MTRSDMTRSDMTTTLANQPPRINLANDGSRQSAQVVNLKSGQQNASSLTQKRLTQNRRCTHLSFVQAQHYRVALESRAIRKLFRARSRLLGSLKFQSGLADFRRMTDCALQRNSALS